MGALLISMTGIASDSPLKIKIKEWLIPAGLFIFCVYCELVLKDQGALELLCYPKVLNWWLEKMFPSERRLIKLVGDELAWHSFSSSGDHRNRSGVGSFWLFGFMPLKWLPIHLPVSALMFICPIVVALILTYREDGARGIWKLLKRIFDYKRIKQKSWFFLILFLMPMIMLLSYWVMSLIGRTLPEPHIPFLSIPILLVMYFLAAVCEEIGWMGYAIEPMLNRWSALTTSVIMGALWAIWHIIPYFQTSHSITWIVWQCFTTILLRILMVWLYNNAGKRFCDNLVPCYPKRQCNGIPE